MSESQKHLILVRALADYISKKYLKGEAKLLQIDSAGQQAKPPAVGSFIPDAYFYYSVDDFLIIGEAKTDIDLEAQHSYQQIETFIQHCAAHRKGILVLAVPWFMIPFSRGLVRSICVKHNIKELMLEVIERLPG